MIYYETSKIATNLMLALDISRKLSNIDIEKRIDLIIVYIAKKGPLTKNSVFCNNIWRSISIHDELLRDKVKTSIHYNNLINHFNSIDKNTDNSIYLNIIDILKK